MTVDSGGFHVSWGDQTSISQNREEAPVSTGQRREGKGARAEEGGGIDRGTLNRNAQAGTRASVTVDSGGFHVSWGDGPVVYNYGHILSFWNFRYVSLTMHQ